MDTVNGMCSDAPRAKKCKCGKSPTIFDMENGCQIYCAIRERIQDTPGVLSILSFDTNYDGTSRRVTFTSSIDTIYGQTTVTSEA